MSAMMPRMDTAETLKRLDQIRYLAIADAALLIVLVVCAITDSSAVHVLGPIHGVGFLGLLYLCARGAGEERWGWWFPAVVLVTAGPPGSLVGDVKIRRELAAATA
jgi:hypothetical protein